MAPEGVRGGDEEAAARQALEEALHQQQDAAARLQEEVEQLRRERDERQAAVAVASADASQGEEGGGMVQMLEGEIQRQRELLTSYEAELEQHRQEKTAMTAGMTTALDITAPLTAPVVGQQQAGTEGQMVSLQPVGDEERQTLESTIQALEEANRQLVEGFQKVEGKLARVNEVSSLKFLAF
jgi:multidrug resistance efflux pump